MCDQDTSDSIIMGHLNHLSHCRSLSAHYASNTGGRKWHRNGIIESNWEFFCFSSVQLICFSIEHSPFFLPWMFQRQQLYQVTCCPRLDCRLALNCYLHNWLSPCLIPFSKLSPVNWPDFSKATVKLKPTCGMVYQPTETKKNKMS